MTCDDHHRRMDAARLRAELSVQDLWLRYLALGGMNDAFDLDGYLQGLMPLDEFQQDVLAQTINEALQDSYDRYRVPMAGPSAGTEDGLLVIIRQLLDDAPPVDSADRPQGGGPGA